MNSEALLAGRIFDDRGNRMTPTRPQGLKYRYYLSSTLLQGQADRSGSVPRIPAAEIETLIINSVRERLQPSEPIDDHSLVNTHVARIEVQPDQLVIELARTAESKRRRGKRDHDVHSVA